MNIHTLKGDLSGSPFIKPPLNLPLKGETFDFIVLQFSSGNRWGIKDCMNPRNKGD
jgi:hypothetical protein